MAAALRIPPHARCAVRLSSRRWCRRRRERSRRERGSRSRRRTATRSSRARRQRREVRARPPLASRVASPSAKGVVLIAQIKPLRSCVREGCTLVSLWCSGARATAGGKGGHWLDQLRAQAASKRKAGAAATWEQSKRAAKGGSIPTRLAVGLAAPRSVHRRTPSVSGRRRRGRGPGRGRQLAGPRQGRRRRGRRGRRGTVRQAPRALPLPRGLHQRGQAPPAHQRAALRAGSACTSACRCWRASTWWSHVVVFAISARPRPSPNAGEAATS